MLIKLTPESDLLVCVGRLLHLAGPLVLYTDEFIKLNIKGKQNTKICIKSI